MQGVLSQPLVGGTGEVVGQQSGGVGHTAYIQTACTNDDRSEVLVVLNHFMGYWMTSYGTRMNFTGHRITSMPHINISCSVTIPLSPYILTLVGSWNNLVTLA